LSLLATPFTNVQAKGADTAKENQVTVQKTVKAEAIQAAEKCKTVITLDFDVQPSPVPSPSQKPVEEQKVVLVSEKGKTVDYVTPYTYTKKSQIAEEKYSVNFATIPSGYNKDVIIPIKVSAKGALVVAAASSEGKEADIYSVYQDKACQKGISIGTDKFAYVPKAGTYYMRIRKNDFEKNSENVYAIVSAFISGNNAELKNNSNVVSASMGTASPIYYKMAVSKTSKLTIKLSSDWSFYATLCNSRKSAITHEEYIYSGVGKVVYVVPKGTYYLKIKAQKETFYASAVFTPVSNAGMTSKSKAGTLKINGSTRNVLVCPGDSTSRGYYMKFTNPKRQKVAIQITTSYTSGKMQFDFYDSGKDSWGKRTLNSGLNKKYEYHVYSTTYNSNSKTLPKGTYYLRFRKLDKKTSGIIGVSIKRK
jgi:hypothetical protein